MDSDENSPGHKAGPWIQSNHLPIDGELVDSETEVDLRRKKRKQRYLRANGFRDVGRPDSNPGYIKSEKKSRFHIHYIFLPISIYYGCRFLAGSGSGWKKVSLYLVQAGANLSGFFCPAARACSSEPACYESTDGFPKRKTALENVANGGGDSYTVLGLDADF